MKKILISITIFMMSCTAFGQVWQIPQGTPTINADLSDWTDANWINMTSVPYGNPANLSNAKMALKWDTNNIYLAMTYQDTDMQFSQGYLGWNGQDDIEIYINANNDDAYGYDDAGWVTAQQYFVGVMGNNPSDLSSTPATPANQWYTLADSPLPDPVNWPYAVIDAATKVTGNTITYEVRVPTLTDITTGAMRNLAIGDVVGFDVTAADKGDDNYGWLSINDNQNKHQFAEALQDWELVNQLTTVHYTFKEKAPGTWDVLVDVTGNNTSGLSGYEIWVEGVDPSTVSFTENTLGDTSGFLPATLLQGDVDGRFNAGNFQGTGEDAIQGIGMAAVDEDGVVLDAQALLGTLYTEAGLTEANFNVALAGLLNLDGSGYLSTDDLVPTIDVISLLMGDINADGVVDSQDFTILKANYGSAGNWPMGDLNGDGLVDSQDFTILKANYGQTGSVPLTIPEPTTLGLLAIGGLLVARRRKV